MTDKTDLEHAFDDFMEAFKQFQLANDERLTRIERQVPQPEKRKTELTGSCLNDDYSELIERLRKDDDLSARVEAADAITTLQERVRVLEAALEPFVEVANAIHNIELESNRGVFLWRENHNLDRETVGCSYEHLIAARAALKGGE